MRARVDSAAAATRLVRGTKSRRPRRGRLSTHVAPRSSAAPRNIRAAPAAAARPVPGRPTTTRKQHRRRRQALPRDPRVRGQAQGVQVRRLAGARARDLARGLHAAQRRARVVGALVIEPRRRPTSTPARAAARATCGAQPERVRRPRGRRRPKFTSAFSSCSTVSSRI